MECLVTADSGWCKPQGQVRKASDGSGGGGSGRNRPAGARGALMGFPTLANTRDAPCLPRNSKREAVHLRAVGTWGAGLADGFSGRLQMLVYHTTSVVAEVPDVSGPQALARLPTAVNSAAGAAGAAKVVSKVPQKQHTM